MLRSVVGAARRVATAGAVRRIHIASASVASAERVGVYTGGKKIPYTSDLSITVPDPEVSAPCFQLMDVDGTWIEGAEPAECDEETAVSYYQYMVRLQVLDTIFYDAQRQGRISFYMTCTGEEGIHIGSADGLKPEDMIYAQYREAGVLMWRGFSLQQVADQCLSNVDDAGKGRQMPVHYGSADYNYFTISSPLATQIPQAAGTAYKLKLDKADSCVVCYFGEGAASEGDFHAAMNFAATLECPVVFFCRNNGYAISTPVWDQFRGDGIIGRAAGYGMANIRVDGNDLFAVREATKAAREYAIANSQPVFLEAMTYRQGHHSTSDDSSAYRDVSDIDFWRTEASPLVRFRKYMEANGWWDDDKETALRKSERKAVMQAMLKAEAKPKPGPHELFSDVYDEMVPSQKEQEAALKEHMDKYPDVYAAGTGH